MHSAVERVMSALCGVYSNRLVDRLPPTDAQISAPCCLLHACVRAHLLRTHRVHRMTHIFIHMDALTHITSHLLCCHVADPTSPALCCSGDKVHIQKNKCEARWARVFDINCHCALCCHVVFCCNCNIALPDVLRGGSS